MTPAYTIYSTDGSVLGVVADRRTAQRIARSHCRERADIRPDVHNRGYAEVNVQGPGGFDWTVSLNGDGRFTITDMS